MDPITARNSNGKQYIHTTTKKPFIMNFKTILSVLLIGCLIASCTNENSSKENPITTTDSMKDNMKETMESKNTTKKLVYPESKMGAQVDNYNGTEIADPYRWLEDDNAADTKAWVTAQNVVTQDYLKNIPMREKIEKR